VPTATPYANTRNPSERKEAVREKAGILTDFTSYHPNFWASGRPESTTAVVRRENAGHVHREAALIFLSHGVVLRTS
jgi:hypothetical protein